MSWGNVLKIECLVRLSEQEVGQVRKLVFVNLWFQAGLKFHPIGLMFLKAVFLGNLLLIVLEVRISWNFVAQMVEAQRVE